MHDATYSSVLNRRSGRTDLLIRSLRVFSVVNVMVVIIALQLIAVAQPSPYFYTGRQLPENASWDLMTLKYLLYVMVFGFIVGVSGLFVNTKRLKRKSDHLRINLLIVTITSFVGIIVYVTY